jgi:hypothetical protein
MESPKMNPLMRLTFLRLIAVLYWAVFAGYTLWVARFAYMESWVVPPYPLWDMWAILITLGLRTYILYWIVRSTMNARPSHRLVLSLAFALQLFYGPERF